jgi:hypothetical protein
MALKRTGAELCRVDHYPWHASAQFVWGCQVMERLSHPPGNRALIASEVRQGRALQGQLSSQPCYSRPALLIPPFINSLCLNVKNVL